MLSKLFGGWGGGKSSAPPKEVQKAARKISPPREDMMMDMCEDMSDRSMSPDRNERFFGMAAKEKKEELSNELDHMEAMACEADMGSMNLGAPPISSNMAMA